MSFGKATALTVGFVCAFALGVWTGPYMTDRVDVQPDRTAAIASEEPANTPAAAPAPRRARTKAPAATTNAEAVASNLPRETGATVVAVPASSPELQGRLKKVLRSGARMDVAADGFTSAEQFAIVAHASRNTDVPFMLLKHRVVNEGKSVEAAIRESKPEMDAAAEASRAREQAREDIASLQSGN